MSPLERWSAGAEREEGITWSVPLSRAVKIGLPLKLENCGLDFEFGKPFNGALAGETV